MAFFVLGNLVGAGILGLPIQAGFAGFLPCLLGIILVGVALFYTATVLSDEAIRTKKPKFHYPSLYHEYLGPVGRWVAVVSNLVIFYGFLIAYLSGAATIIKELVSVPVSGAVVTVVFFALITALAIANPRALTDYTAVFVILLLASFAVLVLTGERHITPGRLEYANWKFFPFIVPILITALSFHNIIPNICKDLGWKRPAILAAMIIGAVAGYLITVLWVQVSMGVLPVDGDISIASAYRDNLPSTVPLSQIIKSRQFIDFSLLFALLAIITSYLTNGAGLMEFVDDLLSNYFERSSRLLVVLLAFAPPLVITLVYPNIFLVALDVVGGLGLALLFGLLPCVIAVLRARSAGRPPVLGVIMFVCFMAVILFKIAMETGLVKLEPGPRYIRYNFTHYVTRPTEAKQESLYSKQHPDGVRR